MGIFVNDFVNKIYSLPKTPEAVSDFLNSEYEEVLPSGKVVKRQMWERFEGAYVRVTRHYVRGTNDDEADIYLYAHKLISRCVLAPVAPYFESDGQLFSYFQLMVRNTRINNSVKEEKESFLLIDDLVSFDESRDDNEAENLRQRIMREGRSENELDTIEALDFNSSNLEKSSYLEVFDVIDNLVDENGLPDSDLILFGRLFVHNNFSYDGMYGLCGFDLKKFKEVKKRFISTLKKHYENELKGRYII